MYKVVDLDVYKKCKILLRHTLECVRHFNKDFRDSLGKAMIEQATLAFISICEANPLCPKGKVEKLEIAKTAIRMLDGFFQASFDIKALKGVDKRDKAIFYCADAIGDVTRWKRYNKRALLPS